MKDRTELLETIKDKIEAMSEFKELNENFNIKFDIGFSCPHQDRQFAVGGEMDDSMATTAKLVLEVRFSNEFVVKLQDEINYLINDEKVKQYMMNVATLKQHLKTN